MDIHRLSSSRILLCDFEAVTRKVKHWTEREDVLPGITGCFASESMAWLMISAHWSGILEEEVAPRGWSQLDFEAMKARCNTSVFYGKCKSQRTSAPYSPIAFLRSEYDVVAFSQCRDMRMICSAGRSPCRSSSSALLTSHIRAHDGADNYLPIVLVPTIWNES